MDLKGTATLPILCKFMQESAWHQAENLGIGFSHLIKEKLLWVLSQQLIKIVSYPKWGEKIQIRTWPSGKDRLAYYRDFKITNEQNQEIGLVTSKWYTIELTNRKPKDIDSYFNFESKEGEKIVYSELNKLSSLTSKKFIKSFKVGYNDLDVNEHVNNVRYIEWLIESFPLDFQKSKNLKMIEIIYLAEAFYDDKLSVYNNKNGANTFYHSLINDKNGKEICRVTTKWE